ncbi:MAG: CHY zinc finger protein [Bacteroidia bacterium]|nr:CHY zinc finger protein [Bacteroidia bacterium]
MSKKSTHSFSEILIGGQRVQGLELDSQSRCVHWNSELDIVALRMPEDEAFYACYECYEAIHHTLPPRWKKEDFEEAKSILCGQCGTVMSVRTYLDSKNHCPSCKSSFNPGCAKHYHFYFE